MLRLTRKAGVSGVPEHLLLGKELLRIPTLADEETRTATALLLRMPHSLEVLPPSERRCTNRHSRFCDIAYPALISEAAVGDDNGRDDGRAPGVLTVNRLQPLTVFPNRKTALPSRQPPSRAGDSSIEGKAMREAARPLVVRNTG